MHSFQASYLIGAVVVVYIIFRQLQPRRPTWFRFFGLPAIAVYEAVLSLHQTGLTGLSWYEIALSGVIGVLAGILQAAFTRVYEREGRTWMQGDWRYLFTWIGLLVTRGVVTWLWLRPASGHVNATVIWADIGVTWTARSVAL
ncbi:MAG: DUF1453 family protein, partial [Alicyclobacillus mali]|uniref:CcdC protein domain-containing protein n=1 Tax=Alicyclobacillus mali (ex Roth et al. 2021) TaxID=1123961 RepID=UPI0023F2DC9F